MTSAALFLVFLFPPSASGADPRARSEVAASSSSVPAQTEVTASSGPVRLTFGVYKTHIKVGESLWYRIRITNRGKKPFRVVDKIFDDPWEIRLNSNRRRGVFLVITDPKGKVLHPSPMVHGHWTLPTEPFVNTKANPELKALMEQWRGQGLSDEEVRMRAVEYTLAKNGAEARRHQFFIDLKPGESVATPPWIYDGRAKPWLNEPAREPIGDFAELHMFAFDEPGKYKVRAIYDERYWFHTSAELKQQRELAKESAALRKILAEDAKRKPAVDEVGAETQWVEFTVLP